MTQKYENLSVFMIDAGFPVEKSFTDIREEKKINSPLYSAQWIIHEKGPTIHVPGNYTE